MKGFLISIVIISTFLGVNYDEHNYIRKECQVIQVDGIKANIMDKIGHIWQVEGEELKAGDIVDLKMYDNLTTSNFFDDVIKEVIKR